MDVDGIDGKLRCFILDPEVVLSLFHLGEFQLGRSMIQGGTENM